jgi:hypothetical protein
METWNVSEENVRTSAYLSFRMDAATLRQRVPPGLSFLRDRLSDRRSRWRVQPDRDATAEVDLTPAELEATLAWGRTPDGDGRTILQSAFVEDHYDRADLEGRSLVELVEPLRVEAPPVRNLQTAYELSWTCTRCDRVTVRQVGDLDVDFDEAAEEVPDFRGHPEVLFTPERALLIAARWQPVLKQHSVLTRPLLGTTLYVQAVVPEVVALETDRTPLESGDACPGCGVRSITRVVLLEGDPPRTDAAGLRVTRDRPLSILAAKAELPPISASTRPIDDLVEIHPDPEHRVGDRAPPDRARELLDARGHDVLFISEPLLAALWDGGATGLEYRPVVRGT